MGKAGIINQANRMNTKQVPPADSTKQGNFLYNFLSEIVMLRNCQCHDAIESSQSTNAETASSMYKKRLTYDSMIQALSFKATPV